MTNVSAKNQPTKESQCVHSHLPGETCTQPRSELAFPKAQAVGVLKDAQDADTIRPVLLAATSRRFTIAEFDELSSNVSRDMLTVLAQMTACHVLRSLVETVQFGGIIYSPTSSMLRG